MFNLFDRVPKINNWESESREIVPDQHFDATVEFDSIEFKYPSRPDASVLQNLSLKVKRGQRIALVGSSGCKCIFRISNCLKSILFNLKRRKIYFNSTIRKIL